MNEKNASALMSALLLAGILGANEKEEEKETETTETNKDEIRKQSEDLGNAYYHTYLGFKDAGFTDEQAFELLLATIRRV